MEFTTFIRSLINFEKFFFIFCLIIFFKQSFFHKWVKILKSNGLILLPHISKLNQIISWYRETVHKETIGFISNIYRNVIFSLSTIYPNESMSVNYEILYDDEKEFFTKHLPIRVILPTVRNANINGKINLFCFVLLN